MNENDISASRAKYAQLHQGADAVARYERKLSNRIDVLRDEIEVQTLAPLLKGTLFDCTIGLGRLIGRMPGVTRYDGMDLSIEFIEHVLLTFFIYTNPEVLNSNGYSIPAINSFNDDFF